jgi:hypothetical protein
MTLTDSLNQILEWHRKNNTPASRLLQPGLGEEEIRRKLTGLPVRVSSELVELYKWRNGTAMGEEGEDTSLFEIHRFLPLEEAIDNVEASDPVAQEGHEPGEWVLVFQDATSDGYALRGEAVVLVMEGEARTVFSSLAKMMETVAAAFEQGAMGWEDEEMETDFFGWGELAHRMDPGVRYWKDYLAGEE